MPPQLHPRPGPHPYQRSRQREPSPCSRTTQATLKMRPRRKKREHHQRLPGAIRSAPGTSQPPRGQMSTSVKHPQLPQPLQHPQPPRSAANENSSQANLPDQTDIGRLYKRAHSSLSKDATARSRQDSFSGSTLSFCSRRSHRDYFSG